MKYRHFAAAAATLAALFGTYYVYQFPGTHAAGEPPGLLSKTAWQRMALPGGLSRAHSFLEHDCAACHTAVRGVEAVSCVACHADDESLLQRQPTAFHADVGSCVECHREHRGVDRRPTDMDHTALSRIGLRRLKADPPDDENRRVRKDLLAWIGRHRSGGDGSEDRSSLTPQEAVLNCATCHATEDRHDELFGRDCAQCHGTTRWAVPEFRHPSPDSKDCGQCHQAPPSHYMAMCFQMMARAARKPHARVDQCYRCHQTIAWKDLKAAD